MTAVAGSRVAAGLDAKSGIRNDTSACSDIQFTRPDGTPLAESIPVEKCFRGNNLSARNREHGITIDPTTIDSRWLGERMDYSIAIDALIAARARSQQAAGP